MFTGEPLNATTLLSRLNRYSFFKRRRLPLALARNALCAAKLVQAGQGQRPSLKKKSHLHVDQPDTEQILERMYTHSPLLEHSQELWRDLLLQRPWPSLKTQFALLQRLRTPEVLYACLRVNLAAKQFVPSFTLIDMAPVTNQRVVGTVSLITAGIISGALWLPSPLLALGLSVFWLGLARAVASPPEYPFVSFDPVHTSLLYRIRHLHSLRMANMILTAFHETASTTTANYHRRAALPDAPPTLQLEIGRELNKRKMVLQTLSSMDLLYADYWSPELQRWQNVEWREPDQDPAEIVHDRKTIHGRFPQDPRPKDPRTGDYP